MTRPANSKIRNGESGATGGDEPFFRIGGPLTAPLAPLYSIVASARNRLYDAGLLVSYRAPLPVICVGNATVGGSGKSPVAAAIAAELKKIGRNPVILSRGYGGSATGPIEVSGVESADQVGDEPLMHRKFLNPGIPLVVSRDRVVGAAFIAERNLGDIIVLDDGYQHRRLRRDINLLLVDGSSDRSQSEWQEGRMLPAGRFRESPAQALRRADAVLVVSRSATGVSKQHEKFKALSGGENLPIPQIGVELISERVIELATGNEIALDALSGTRCSAACGLARPDQMFSAVESLGVEIQNRYVFGDHHPYSAPELRQMLSDGNPLIVTAKDAAKLQPFLRTGDKIFVLMQGVRFWSDKDRDALAALLGPFRAR